MSIQEGKSKRIPVQSGAKIRDLMARQNIGQAELAYKMNEIFNEDKMSQRQISSLCREIYDLDVATGLAMSNALGTYLGALLRDDLLTLGNLETRFINFNQNEKGRASQYILKFEQHGRLTAFSSFPSYIHFFTENAVYTNTVNEATIAIHRQRRNSFLRGKSQEGMTYTREYYTIDSALHFSLSDINLHSIETRIKVLENVIHTLYMDHNSLHFFVGDDYPYTIANLMISEADGLILSEIPMGIAKFLEIYNKKLVAELSKFFVEKGMESKFQHNVTFSSKFNSIQLVQNMVDLLSGKGLFKDKSFEEKIKVLYKDSHPTIQNMIYPYIESILNRVR